MAARIRSPRAASIGVLSHGAGVYNNLTARENITYFGELHGLSRADRDARAAELIEMLEMQPFADRAARKGSRRARSSRPRWRARWCTGRATCCSTNPPTGST